MIKGFPRPRAIVDNKSYPIPYTAEDNVISALNDDRMRECVDATLCIVCAEPVQEETCHVLLNRNSEGNYIIFAESGPFHDKCLTITVKMCPHIIDNPKYKRDILPTQSVINWLRTKYA